MTIEQLEAKLAAQLEELRNEVANLCEAINTLEARLDRKGDDLEQRIHEEQRDREYQDNDLERRINDVAREARGGRR